MTAGRKNPRESGFLAACTFEKVLTRDPGMEQKIRMARMYAASEASVLITGESGTGKELFAQSMHNASPRRDGPFVAVNCAAIPESLVESELFGYESGAFTGAKREGRAGYFELADHGTLFLDEIGELPLSAQALLLRALQEKKILRVGGSSMVPVDVRILCATNRDIRADAARGTFRKDFYYRVSTLELSIPPLRERPGDIPLLAGAFAKEEGLDEAETALLLEKLSRLGAQHFAGNVRELKSLVQRFAILCPAVREKTLSAEMLDEALGIRRASSEEALVITLPFGLTLRELSDEAQRQICSRYLSHCGGDTQEAARQLGIGRTTLWRKSAAHKEQISDAAI